MARKLSWKKINKNKSLAIAVGTYVISTKGRFGLVDAIDENFIALVRVGSSGPHKRIPCKNLRSATDEEIETGIYG